MPGEGQRHHGGDRGAEQDRRPAPAQRQAAADRDDQREDHRRTPGTGQRDLIDRTPQFRRREDLTDGPAGGVGHRQRHQQCGTTGPGQGHVRGPAHRTIATDVEQAARLRRDEKRGEQQRTDGQRREQVRQRAHRGHAVGGQRPGIGDAEQGQRLGRREPDHQRGHHCGDRTGQRTQRREGRPRARPRDLGSGFGGRALR